MGTRKRRILIICEGYEEKPYIDKLLSFPCIRNDVYEFAPSINVKGNSQLFARYQDAFMSNYYELILIFCDTDKGSKEYLEIKQKINDKIFGGKNIADMIFIFSNPVTLQVVLSHFEHVTLNNVGKKTNAPIVERLTGIKEYDAHQDQIEEMIRLVTYKNYSIMKDNMRLVSTDEKVIPSSNILLFLERFESKDTSWIDEINDTMKGGSL